MVIEGRCDRCQSPYRVDEALVGRRARCDVCGNQFVVAAPAPPAAATPPAATPVRPAPATEPSRPPSPPPQAGGPHEGGHVEALDLLAASAAPCRRVDRLGRPVPWRLVIGTFVFACLATAAVTYMLWGREPAADEGSGGNRSAARAETPRTPPETRPGQDEQLALRDDKPRPKGGGKPVEDPEQPKGRAATRPGAEDPSPKTRPTPPTTAPAPRPKRPARELDWFTRIVHPPTGGEHMVAAKVAHSGTTAELWRIEPRRQLAVLQLPAGTNDFALSPSGDRLAAVGGTPRRVRVYSFAKGGEPTATWRAGTERMHKLLGFAGESRVVMRRWTPLGTMLEVYDAAKGTLLSEGELRSGAGGAMAMSPDGTTAAFLAVNGDAPSLLLYDLDGGGLKSRETLPGIGEGAAFRAGGVAFRADGERLASLYSVNGRWHVAVHAGSTGQVLRTIPVDLGGARPIDPPAGGGSVLDWVGDAGWLAFGQVVIGRKTGRALQRVYDRAPTAQIMLDDRTVLLVTGTRHRSDLKLVRLDGAGLADAAREAHADLVPVVEPPPLGEPWRAARPDAPYRGPVRWTSCVDPAADTMDLESVDIALDPPADASVQVAFAAAAPRAAVLRYPRVQPARPPERIGGPAPTLAVYDLAKGDRLGRFAVPTYAKLLDVSPDGSRVLTGSPGDFGPKLVRLDLWSLPEGVHVAGWQPSGGRIGADVSWARFMTDDRVLTLSRNVLDCWSIEQGRSLWAVGGIGGMPVLTPGRNYVICRTMTYLRVFSTRSGYHRGDLDTPPGRTPTLEAATFSRDGRTLRGMLSVGAGPRSARWDLRTGRRIEDPAPEPPDADLLPDGPRPLDWRLVERDGRLHLMGQPADSPD